MIVVADTSPLNYLVLIDQERLLPRLFGEVRVPPAVVSELNHPGAPQAVRDWIAQPPAWLQVQAPAALDETIDLGRGELEAICLAREIGADFVLIDERMATRMARGFGLATVGVLGILEVAARRKLVQLEPALAALRDTNFQAPSELYDHIIARHRGHPG